MFLGLKNCLRSMNSNTPVRIMMMYATKGLCGILAVTFLPTSDNNNSPMRISTTAFTGRSTNRNNSWILCELWLERLRVARAAASANTPVGCKDMEM